jgi:hypothetical protein
MRPILAIPHVSSSALTHPHEVLEPAATRALVPALARTRNPDVWVHRYTHAKRGWTLSIATHGVPGAGQLSLGGFRIAPAARTDAPGWDDRREAIELAMGMEEKVHWSRVIRAGGPLGREQVSGLVGGKCVLTPTPDARVGQPRDVALLDFALACFADFEAASGVRLNTGQDLGHGTLTNGVASLDYLADRFHGAVSADTSKPTGEGNFFTLAGMLAASGVPLARARVALVGCGNIGAWVLARLRDAGAEVVVIEAMPAKREQLAALGIDARAGDAKLAALAEPLDAVVVNANGGSLDAATCAVIAANARVTVVCGSENLAMPDPASEARLRAAGKVYAPTEFGGMMGYLTAVEAYLARHAGQPFALSTMLQAATALEEAGRRATERVRASGFAMSFEEAVTEVYAAR